MGLLSAVAGEKSLRAAVDRFSPVGADRLILTKLDEAEGLGGVLSLFGRSDRPVSYLTTGQAVVRSAPFTTTSRVAP